MVGSDLKRVIDALPEAVLACDGKGSLRAFNRAAERLLGIGEGDLGSPARSLLPDWGGPDELDDDEPYARTWASHADGTRLEVEIAIGSLGRKPADQGFLVTLRPAVPSGSSSPGATDMRAWRAVAQAGFDTGEVVDPDAWRASVVRALVDDFGALAAGLWYCSKPGEFPSLRAIAVAGRESERGKPDHEDLAAIVDPAHPAWSLADLAGVVASGRPRMESDARDASRGALAWMARHGVRSVVSQPLRRSGRLTGVLVVFSSSRLHDTRSNALAAFAAVIASAGSDIHIDQVARDARDEAEDQRRRLQTILDVLPVGVVLLEGPEGRVTLVNPTARQMNGARPTVPLFLDEFPDSLPVYHLDGRPFAPTERPLWRALKRGERVREILRYRQEDRPDSIFDVAAAPFPGPSGGAVMCFRDVTEEVQLRSELGERAAQFKALLDHLPVGVAYFDDQGVCRAANGPARKFLLGRLRPGEIEARAAEVFASAPLLRQALERCLRERCSHQEHSAPWPDRSGSGGLRYLDWQFEPLSLAHGRSGGVLALMVEVTDRKLASDQLRHAVETAVQASRTKTQFLSAVSHDLRTPVNALRLLAEWLALVAERQSDPDPELRGLVSDVRRATSNLVDLVNDLLELTLIDSGAMAFRPMRFPLRLWLDEVLSPLRVTARAKGLELVWSLDDPGRVALADRVKLGRVLVNLVANALKFTEEGRVEVSVGAGPQGELTLRVCDTGPGIPGSELDRIFDEFAQLRNPERDRTKGTGLGLAICRRLVHGAGGRLSVESTLGIGSTFTAVYPPDHLVDDPGPPVEVPPPRSAPPVEPADGKAGSGPCSTILLVEDDPYSRRSLARLLERDGYRVLQAGTGQEALDLVTVDPPALILLDLMMPNMDGVTMLRRVRATHDSQRMPVIVLTGDLLSGRIAELDSLDINGLLAKPIELDELRAILKTWLGHTTVRPNPH